MRRFLGMFFWNIKRKKVLRRDHYICQYCGSMNRATLVVDHLWPRAKGGSNRMTNLVTACKGCNSSKGGKTLREWIGSFRPTTVTIMLPSENEQSLEFVPGIHEEIMREFARGAIAGKPLSQSEWTGAAGILSRSEFNGLMEYLQNIGVVRWRRPQYPAQGRVLTGFGTRFMREFADHGRNGDLPKPEPISKQEPLL